MTLKSLGLVLTLAGAISGFARGDDFFFTMSGTAGTYSVLFTTTVPGAITGELVGLQDNATSLPTEVIINSVPVDPPYFNFPPVFENGPTAADDGYSSFGGFTVTDGNITGADADFQYQPQGFGGQRAFAEIEFNFGGTNYAYDSGFGAPYLQAADGFAGVSYSAAAVPEPGPSGLLVLGAMVLVAGKQFFWARRSVS
jgi:hypothetical protein